MTTLQLLGQCDFYRMRRQEAIRARRTRNLVDSLDTVVITAQRRSTVASAPWEQPRALARYRLLERLGQGGFGVVWRAHDDQLGREVALKRIPLTDGVGDQTIERAEREAKAAARLKHPAIVALYDTYVDDDGFYLISELVHGDTLARLIADDGLADEQVLAIGVALADALVHAHEHDVIHRDVKPQNVLVAHTPDARGAVAKLTDFGGALLVDEQALTRTGDVLGTIAYMAPEQCDGGELSEAVDLYSLALVLYEALSGVNPVRGATPAATVRRLGQELPALERERRDLPRELTRALDTALAPDPEDRGTLQELQETLEDTLADGLQPKVAERTRVLRRRILPVAAPAWEASAPAPMHAQPQRYAAHIPDERLDDHERERERERERGLGLDVDDEELLDHGDWLTLQRAAWLGVASAVIAWQGYVGRPGVALLAFAAVLLLVVLRRRPGPEWVLGALAPVLGLASLAGAFPALAGQVAGWRARATLGALGFWWLSLAEPLFGRRLWLALAGVPASAGWEGSIGTAAAHVVGPLLSLAVVAGALLWAAGALVLPWVVRGRSAVHDILGATVWAAVLLGVGPLLERAVGGVDGSADLTTPHGAVLGACAGAVLAVSARALRGPV